MKINVNESNQKVASPRTKEDYGAVIEAYKAQNPVKYAQKNAPQDIFDAKGVKVGVHPGDFTKKLAQFGKVDEAAHTDLLAAAVQAQNEAAEAGKQAQVLADRANTLTKEAQEVPHVRNGPDPVDFVTVDALGNVVEPEGAVVGRVARPARPSRPARKTPKVEK